MHWIDRGYWLIVRNNSLYCHVQGEEAQLDLSGAKVVEVGKEQSNTLTSEPSLLQQAKAIFDGDPSKVFRTNHIDCSTSTYVTVDLGFKATVEGVILYHDPQVTSYCRQRVEISEDQSHWSNVYDTKAEYGPSEVRLHKCCIQAMLRYLRFVLYYASSRRALLALHFYQTIAGNKVLFSPTTARYIRHFNGRSKFEPYTTFSYIEVLGSLQLNGEAVRPTNFC